MIFRIHFCLWICFLCQYTFVSCESSSEVSRERIFVSAERVGVLSAEIDDDDDDDVDDDDDTDDIIDVRGRGKSPQAASRAERRKNALSMIAQLRLLRKLKSRVAKNLSWRSFLRLIKSLKQKSSFHLLLKSLTKKKSISSKPVQSKLKSKLPSLKLLSKINNNKTKTISLNVDPSPKINDTSSNPTSKRPNKSTISSIPPQSLQPKQESSITKSQTSSSSKPSSASSGIQSGPQLKKHSRSQLVHRQQSVPVKPALPTMFPPPPPPQRQMPPPPPPPPEIPNYLVARKSENKLSTKLSTKTVQSTKGTVTSSQTKTSFSSKGHLSNFPTDTSFDTKQASSLNRVSLISNPPKITQSRQSKQAQIWIPNVNSKTQARQSSIKNSISNDNEETYSIHIPMPSPPPTPTTPKPTGTSKPIQTVYIEDASFTKSNINPATANLGLRQSTELKKSIEPSFPKLISQGIPIMNVFSDNDKANTVPSIGNSKSVTLKSKDRPSLTNTQDSNSVMNSLSTNRHMSKSLDEESMVSLISNSNNKNTNSAVVIPKATQWTFPVVRNSQTVSISSPKLLASPTSPGAAIIPSVLEDTKSSSLSKPMNKTTLVKKEVTLGKDTKVITKAVDKINKPQKGTQNEEEDGENKQPGTIVNNENFSIKTKIAPNVNIKTAMLSTKDRRTKVLLNRLVELRKRVVALRHRKLRKLRMQRKMRRNKSSQESYESSSREVGSVESGEVMPTSGEVHAYSKTDDDNGGNGDKKRRMNRMKAAVTKILMLSKQRRLKLTPKAMTLIAKWIRMYKDLNSKTKHNTMARKNKKSAHNSLKTKGSHKPNDYVSTSTSVEIIPKVKGKSKSSVAAAKSESVTGQTGVKMTTNDGTVSKLQIHPMAGNPVIATEKVEISGKLHAAGIQILNHGQTSTTTIENNDTGDIESLSTKGDQPVAIDKKALGIIVPLESLREGDNPTSSKILKVQNAANQSPSESLSVESTNIDEGASLNVVQNKVRGIPVQLFDQSPKVKTSLGKAAESTIAEQRLREGKRLRAILQRMAMARQLRKRLMERERAASSTNIDKASSAEISSSAGPKSFIMNSIDTFTNRKPKTTHVRKRRSVPQNVEIMKLSRGKRHLALLQPGGIFVNGNLGTFGVQSIMSSSINPTNVLGGIPIQVNTGQVNPPSYAFMNQQNQQTLFVPQYKKPSSSSYDKKPVSSYDKKPVSSSYDKKPIQTYGISNHMGHPQKSQVINNLSGFQSLSPLGGSVSHHMAGNMRPAGGGLVVHSGSQMNPPHTVAISNQMSNSGMISGSHISHANVIHAPPQISQPAVVHQPLPPGSRLPNINFDKVNSGLARNRFLTKSVEVPQTPGKPKIHIHLSINPKTYGKKSPKKQIYEKQGNGFLQENSLSISPQDYGAVSQFIEQGSYDKVESPQSLVGSLSSSSHFHSSSSLGSPQGGGFLVSQPSPQGTQGGIFSQTQVVQPEQKRPKFIQISKQIMQKPVIVQTSEPAISLNPPLPPPVAVQLPPPPPPPPLPMLPFQSPPPPSPPSPIVPMRPDPVSGVVKQEMSMNGDGSILSNIPFMGSQTENIDALGGGLGIDIAGGAFYDGVAQPAFKLPKVLEKPNESPYIDVINQVESQVSQIINNELAPQMDLTGIKDITQGLSSNSISGGGQFSNIVVNNGLSSQNIVEQPMVINKDPITPENSYNNGLSQIGSQGLNSIDSAVIEGQGTSIMNNALSMPSLQSQGQEVINSGLSSQNSFNNIQVVESGFNSRSEPSVGSILSATSFVGSNGQNNGNGFNIFDNSFAAEGWNPPTKVKSNMKVKTDTASLSSTNQIDKLEAAVDGVIGASLSNSYEKQTNSISNMHDAIQNEIMNFVPESNPFIPEVKAEPETYDKKIDAFGNTIDSYDKKPEMFGNALDSYDKKIDSFGNSLGSYDKKSESYDKKVESYDKKIESYDKKVETFVEKKAESYDKKIENIEQGLLNQNQLDRRTTSLSFGQLSPPGQYEGFIVGDPYKVPGYDNTPEPPRVSLTNKVDTSKGIAVPFFDSFVSSVSNSKPAADTILNVGRLNGVSNDMSVKSFNLWMKPTEPPASRWIPPPPPSPPPPPQPTPPPTQPPTPPPAMIYTQTSPAASRYSRTSLSQQFIVSSSGLDQGTFSKDTQNQEQIGQNVLDKVDFGQNELNQDIFSQIALNQGSLSQNSLNQGGLSQNSLNQGGFSQNALNQGRISQNSLNQGGFSQNLLNQGSISQNSFNQESISQNLFNQGSISQNSLNQGSISQNSLNQGSISQNSLNQGSLSQNSLNQGSVFNEGSFSPGPWNKESTNQDSFSQNSLNLGSFSQNSLGGGSFSQNSLGGGSFSQNSLGGGSLRQNSLDGGSLSQNSLGGGSLSQNSLGGGSFSQNSLGGGSFSQNSLGGGSFSQNSLGGGSFSENTFVKENSYAKESNVENNNFEPVVQGSLQGSLGSPSRDISRDIPLFNAGGGQVYDQGFNEPSVDTNLNSLSTGFKSHKSQIAFTVDRPTQVEQIQKTTVPTTTVPNLGFQKGGGFIVSDFGSNGFNLGGGFSLSSFGKNIRNNHNSWTQKQEGVSNQQQENKQNDFFSGGLSGGLSSFGSNGNAGSLMGGGQFHNSHKQTSYKIANDNKMHSSIDSSMSSLSAHSHAVVVKR